MPMAGTLLGAGLKSELHMSGLLMARRCEIPQAGLAIYRSARPQADLARSTPTATATRPASATTGPIIAHTEFPDMKLPPITPNPCSAQITPAMVSSAPTAVSSQFFTVLALRDSVTTLALRDSVTTWLPSPVVGLARAIRPGGR